MPISSIVILLSPLAHGVSCGCLSEVFEDPDQDELQRIYNIWILIMN